MKEIFSACPIHFFFFLTMAPAASLGKENLQYEGKG